MRGKYQTEGQERKRCDNPNRDRSNLRYRYLYRVWT